MKLVSAQLSVTLLLAAGLWLAPVQTKADSICHTPASSFNASLAVELGVCDSSGNLMVKSATGGSTSSPGYTRIQDGTTTNLAAVLADNALSVGTASALVTVNPTVTASSAYSAGNIVGGLLSFTPAFRTPNSGVLESIAISLKSTQAVSFKLYIFNANPSNSTWTDKTAPAINSADVGKLVGVYTLASYDNGMGTSTIYNLDGIGKQISSSSSTLYAVLVTTAAVTFSSSSDVYVSVGVLQD